MTPEEFHQCAEMAEQDQRFNGYRKTAAEYIELIMQAYEVLKRL